MRQLHPHDTIKKKVCAVKSLEEESRQISIITSCPLAVDAKRWAALLGDGE